MKCGNTKCPYHTENVELFPHKCSDWIYANGQPCGFKEENKVCEHWIGVFQLPNLKIFILDEEMLKCAVNPIKFSFCPKCGEKL